jgi:hypothetical protein
MSFFIFSVFRENICQPLYYNMPVPLRPQRIILDLWFTQYTLYSWTSYIGSKQAIILPKSGIYYGVSCGIIRLSGVLTASIHNPTMSRSLPTTGHLLYIRMFKSIDWYSWTSDISNFSRVGYSWTSEYFQSIDDWNLCLKHPVYFSEYCGLILSKIDDLIVFTYTSMPNSRGYLADNVT